MGMGAFAMKAGKRGSRSSFKRIGSSAPSGEMGDSVFSGGSPLDAMNSMASASGGLGSFLSFCLPSFGRG
jgi:hypothetical protein